MTIISFFKKLENPRSKRIMRKNSSKEWDEEIINPTFFPLFSDSSTVTTSKGPGVSAPDKAINKEVKNIKINLITDFQVHK